MKKIRAVLFDMDGLMFDTQRLWDKAWKQAGEACGVPMGEEQIAPLRAAAWPTAAPHLKRMWPRGMCLTAATPWRTPLCANGCGATCR